MLQSAMVLAQDGSLLQAPVPQQGKKQPVGLTLANSSFMHSPVPAISNFTARKYALQASLQTSTQLLQLSLLNYI